MCLAQGQQRSDAGEVTALPALAMSTTYTNFLHGDAYMVCTCQWRIQRGLGGCLNPLPDPRF